MPATPLQIGALDCTVIGSFETAAAAIVMLHGYAMTAADLAPFASSTNLPSVFVVPDAPLQLETGGRAWWPIDTERRALDLRAGPRDLREEYAEGRPAARDALRVLLAEVRRRVGERPIVLGGFSQGGMLSCDFVLHEESGVAGLFALSASPIARADWAPRLARLAGLPALVSHGDRDPDLSFSAGERLRDVLVSGGAEVTWVPFSGGHEIPLVVWRALRKFLISLSR